MKECFKCHETKPLSEFYRHPQTSDGHLGKCKACTVWDVHQNYVAKRDYYVEYKKNNAEAVERRRARSAEALRRWRKLNPHKDRAHDAVHKALRKGTLKRQPCEMCGTTEGVQAHHPDYTKPLEVEWLCVRHHYEREGRSVLAS